MQLLIALTALAAGRGRDPEFNRACHQLVEAADRRKAECDRLWEQYGLVELQEEYRGLSTAAAQAFDAVEACPIITAAELITKLELLNEMGFELPESILLADIRRIAAMWG